ncbi:uncharacterized protein EDB91DRAFT_1087990 [Suillus paluster]|uniref:uncharacterized protein n=1 Tax=Suillus paluster TaxID=48578 RepID=UPI001B86636C|nr:uncharacterized protein EDB91DRAFT_1087990 [Suillus paluster]KAG1722828.1 hypothetical protein EDB91DRAFT_1087990 [Suillus paluster]
MNNPSNLNHRIEKRLHRQDRSKELTSLSWLLSLPTFPVPPTGTIFEHHYLPHHVYEGFIALFGWDLKSLQQTTNQRKCHALFRAGRIGAAVETCQCIIDKNYEG